MKATVNGVLAKYGDLVNVCIGHEEKSMKGWELNIGWPFCVFSRSNSSAMAVGIGVLRRPSPEAVGLIHPSVHQSPSSSEYPHRL